MPQFRNALIGHVILFVGRISFVFASAVFCFAFIIAKARIANTVVSLSSF